MELEQEFICWREGQDESDGHELKAPNLQAAAKKAVVIWRHEKGNDNFFHGKVTVFLRDSNDEIHRVMVAPDSDYESPQAFY